MSRQKRDVEAVDDYIRRTTSPSRWDQEFDAARKQRVFEAVARDRQAHFIAPGNMSPTAQRRQKKARPI
jgi:hypothetical protein